MVDAVREGQGHRGSTPLTSTILYAVDATHPRTRMRVARQKIRVDQPSNLFLKRAFHGCRL